VTLTSPGCHGVILNRTIDDPHRTTLRTTVLENQFRRVAYRHPADQNALSWIMLHVPDGRFIIREPRHQAG
jgi:hypothetical protein